MVGPERCMHHCRPCTIDPKHGYTLVYEVDQPVNATGDEQLNIQMCSLGGYDQVCSDPTCEAGLMSRRRDADLWQASKHQRSA